MWRSVAVARSRASSPSSPQHAGFAGRQTHRPLCAAKPSARELEAQINVFKERYNEQVLFDISNFSDMVYEVKVL